MKCPRCNTELDARSSDAITAAICPRCAGAWLRSEDLAIVIRRFAAEQGVDLKILSLLEGAARPTTLACPACSTMLDTLTLRGVQVERCSNCRGVFLDAGETRTLSQRTVLGSKEWDRAYQEHLRAVRKLAQSSEAPWSFDA